MEFAPGLEWVRQVWACRHRGRTLTPQVLLVSAIPRYVIDMAPGSALPHFRLPNTPPTTLSLWLRNGPLLSQMELWTVWPL